MPPGSKTFLRDSVTWQKMTSTSHPEYNGWAKIEVNENDNAEGVGTISSKWSWCLGAGTAIGDCSASTGIFEGSGEGSRVKGTSDECANGPIPNPPECWIATYKLVGKGTSGTVEGEQFRATAIGYTYTVVPLVFIGTLEVTVF